MLNRANLCVVCEDENNSSPAKVFALAHDYPLFNERNPEFELQLVFQNNGIELYDTKLDTSINIDFLSGTLRHRQLFGGGRKQSIARAVGIKPGYCPTVLDATAGLARDAFVLASLGCTVTLIEQSPVLFTLINDAIQRAISSESINTAISNFTHLVHADSRLYLSHLDPGSKPDTIYIDPMFPERNKTALVKKDMQILQKLLGKDIDSDSLLTTALEHAQKRVVVKRPVHASPVGLIKPSTAITGKKTRYDIYLV